MKLRVMDLAGWPPQSSGAYQRGDVFPQSTEEVTVEGVLRVGESHVSFISRFNDRSIPYDFFVRNATIAEKVVKILTENYGTRLFDIGFIEVPLDEP